VPFRYLRDRLFLACVAAYFINRLVLKRIWVSGFVHDHFNDLICIPFWVPVMLWIERSIGLRRRDGPPDAMEIAVPLVVWSWTFEVFLPARGWLGPHCAADHRDVLWYSVGALAASLAWRRRYGDEGDTGTAGAPRGEPGVP